MATADWTWQDGTEYDDYLWAAGMGGDGSMVLVGDTEGAWSNKHTGASDFVAVKLNSSGNVLWSWQTGGTGNNTLRAVAMGDDGGAVLAGETCENGFWPMNDFFAVKLDADGGVLWTWRSGTAFDDKFVAAAMSQDGSVVIAGDTNGGYSGTHAGETDFAAVKLSSKGKEIWRWQDGTTGYDSISAVAMAEDGSVVLAGTTAGDWASPTYSGLDFAAVKLNADGTEAWRYQVPISKLAFVANVRHPNVAVNGTGVPAGTDEDDSLSAAVIGDDGWIVLAGTTDGIWDTTHRSADGDGSTDFAAVKLDNNGMEIWRWQDGTDGVDVINAAAKGEYTSVILVGGTTGSWATESSGLNDFAATGLDTGDGSQLWKWQVGMTHDGEAIASECTAIATGGTDNSKAVLAGYTRRSSPSSESSSSNNNDFAVAHLDIAIPAPTPTTPGVGSPAAGGMLPMSPGTPPPTPFPTVFDMASSATAHTPGPTPLFISEPRSPPTATGASGDSGGSGLSTPILIAVVISAAVFGLAAVGIGETMRRRARKKKNGGDGGGGGAA